MTASHITHDPSEAGLCLKNGGIVIFPTETVFGIGASAYNHNACQRIYAIKKRPADNPLIIHLATIEQIPTIAFLPDHAHALIETFCPGPLTIILKKRSHTLFTAGLDTVAVRIPQLALARAMIAAAESPIAAPSANLSGKPSITRAQDALDQFQNDVDKILWGPDCTIGLESTVIDLSGEIPLYLRPGSISYETLLPLLLDLKLYISDNSERPASPGMKYRHYSPICQVILVEDLNTIDPTDGGQIGFQLHHKSALDVHVINNEGYAQALYAFFIECDRRGLKCAFCQHPKQDALQSALLNRLQKASTNQP
jgi:L-threonylcarbamoyladenylate synthase